MSSGAPRRELNKPRRELRNLAKVAAVTTKQRSLSIGELSDRIGQDASKIKMIYDLRPSLVHEADELLLLVETLAEAASLLSNATIALDDATALAKRADEKLSALIPEDPKPEPVESDD